MSDRKPIGKARTTNGEKRKPRTADGEESEVTKKARTTNDEEWEVTRKQGQPMMKKEKHG